MSYTQGFHAYLFPDERRDIVNFDYYLDFDWLDPEGEEVEYPIWGFYIAPRSHVSYELPFYEEVEYPGTLYDVHDDEILHSFGQYVIRKHYNPLDNQLSEHVYFVPRTASAPTGNPFFALPVTAALVEEIRKYRCTTWYRANYLFNQRSLRPPRTSH